MKPFLTLSAVLLSLSLSACSQMPKECQESWKKIEALAQQMGLPEEQIKAQREQFEANLKGLSNEDAIQACNMQNSILGMATQSPD